MNEYTPATEDVREAASLNGGIAVEPDAFNRWLRGVLADAWDEGVHAQCAGYGMTPDTGPNPYREENL